MGRHHTPARRPTPVLSRTGARDLADWLGAAHVESGRRQPVDRRSPHRDPRADNARPFAELSVSRGEPNAAVLYVTASGARRQRYAAAPAFGPDGPGRDCVVYGGRGAALQQL